MATQEKARLRDQRKPGWFWAENELFDVFQPLIGALGVSVYTAMCREARHGEVRLGFRELGVLSGVSKDTVARTMIKLVALGMVAEKKGAVKAVGSYELLDLKDAAAVGLEALKRLLSVSQGDRSSKASKLVADPSVSQGDSLKLSLSETDLSQKGANLSLPAANLSHTADPYLNWKEDSREDLKTKNPPTPLGGEVRNGEGVCDGRAGNGIDAGRVGGDAAGVAAVAGIAAQPQSGGHSGAGSGPGAKAQAGGGSGRQAHARVSPAGTGSSGAGRGGAGRDGDVRAGAAAERDHLVLSAGGGLRAAASRASELSGMGLSGRSSSGQPGQPAVRQVWPTGDVRAGLDGVLKVLHDDLLDAPVAPQWAGNGWEPGDLEWAQCFRSVVYVGHEVPEAQPNGLVITIASDDPAATARGLKRYAKRVSAAIVRNFGFEVGLVVRQDGEAAA